MDEAGDHSETLDLSRRGLKKLEKSPTEDETKPIINLILDHNELQRLDNIDTYSRVENLSICNNFLLRMHGVSRLTNIRVLALNNNGILQIEGLKEMTYLKVLKLAGNNIKSIEHLNHNIHLEHLDLSNNQISFIADISYLKSLKHLNLERNKIIDLRQCDRLPQSLEHLSLGHNNIQDLNELSNLVHLTKLDSITVQGNPCVAMAGKDKLGFDYRPFVLNWILSVRTIDGFVVSAIESLKAEWLYSQGKGRHFHSGQQHELCEYLASTCPLTADALETEDQRKLRIILSKAQHHQQQLKDQTSSPSKPKLHSPRMQSRISSRHIGRSPDRLTSSFHSALTKSSSPSSNQMSMSCSGDIMTQSFSSLSCERRESLKEKHDHKQEPHQKEPQKPVHPSLEAASKMVPVPESLMSPDYQDPVYDIQRTIPKPVHSISNVSNASSHSSNSSLQEERQRHPSQSSNRSLRGSPKLTKSATSSPRMRQKLDLKNNEKLKIEDKKVNGVTKTNKSEDTPEKLDIAKIACNQRRVKKVSSETMAAVTIQKMWRGYKSRNLNKDTLRILHAIQAARARQHIQRLTCDMEATKAALDSERKIQQLQMQAINALWKKVSTIQTNDNQKQKCDTVDNSEVLRQLTETCFNLQAQVVELQGSMQEVLKAVSNKTHVEPVGTQTEISAVLTPQEERCTWLRRPQSLPLTAPTPPAAVPPTPMLEENDLIVEKTAEISLETEKTESLIQEEADQPSIEVDTSNDILVE